MKKTFYRRNIIVLLVLFFFTGKMQAQQLVTLPAIAASAAQGIHYNSSTITGTYTFTQVGSSTSMQISGIADYTGTDEYRARYSFSHPTFTNSQIMAVTLKATYSRGSVAQFFGQQPAIVKVNILPCSYSWNTSDKTTLNNIYNCIGGTTVIQTMRTPNNGDYSTYTTQYLLHDPNYGVNNSSYWNPSGTTLDIGLGAMQDAMEIYSMSLIITYKPVIPTVTIIPQTSTGICSGSSVVLTASATGGTGFTYLWTAPAGAASGVTSASYTASVPGVYTVKVTNSQSGYASATKTVTVNPVPTAVITPGSSTNICQGSNVALNASAGSSYQWINNGTAMAGVNNSSYITGTAGLYSVKVTNSYGCSATSAAVPVTVHSVPSATISPAGSPSICQGSSIGLSANTGTGLTYLWNVPAGATTRVTSSNYTATVAGNYSVTVSSTNQCGASVTSSATTLTTKPVPTAVITPNAPPAFCPGGNVLLSATNSTGTGLTYLWNVPAGAITGVASVNYTASIAGGYSVKVLSSNGCSATSAVTTVTTSPVPTASITYTTPLTFCQGGSVTLNAPAGYGLNYLWNVPAGATTGVTTSSYTASIGGNYSVTVGSNYQCGPAVTSSAITVVTNPQPYVPFIFPAGAVTICTGSNTTLNISSGATGPGLSYQWYNNNVAVSGATNTSLVTAIAGNYTVTVKNSNACSATSSIGVQTILQANNIPSVSIVPMGLPAICESQAEVLQAYTTGEISSYQWYYNNVLQDGFTYSDNAVTTPGVYKVVVSNGCQTASASITANSIYPYNVYTSCNTNYTVGQSATVSYYLCGASMAANNVFTAQLSDATGSFANPLVIGTLASTATYGTINATIPIGTLQGTNYRIRVTCSNPVLAFFTDNGADITINNNGGTLLFNAGDKVVVPNNSAYNFSGNFTLEAWVKLPSAQSFVAPAIISTRNYTTTYKGLLFAFYKLLGTNKIDQLVLQIDGNNYYSNYFGSIEDNICHHVAVTRASGTITFYLDGVVVGTKTCATAISSTTPLYMGYDAVNYANAGSSTTYLGNMSDVRVWNVAQSAAAINANRFLVVPGNSPGLVGYWDFNELSGQVVYDQSITANNGSLGTNAAAVDIEDPARVVGAKCFTPLQKSGLMFNGGSSMVGSRATIPYKPTYNFETNDFAIEAWVNLSSGQSNSAAPIVSNRTSTYEGLFFCVYMGTRLLIQVNGNNYLSPIISNSVSIPNGTVLNGVCHHVAVVRTSGVLQFYVDGIPLLGTVACIGSAVSTSDLYIGYEPRNYNSVLGNINEVRIWNATRTPAEIAASYKAVPSSSTPGLVGYWRFQETGDELIYDQSTLANNGYLGSNQFEFDTQNPVRTNNACYSLDRLSSVSTITEIADDSSSTANEVKIYPNPFNTETNIVIEGATQGQSDIRIFDLQGVTLYTGTISFNKVFAIGQQLPSGMFFVEVIVANKRQIFKITKVD